MAGGPKQDVTTTQGTSSGTSQQDSTGYNKAQTGGTTYGSQQVDVPDWLKSFVGQSTGTAGAALGSAADLANNFDISSSTNSLQDTLSGKYLYGGSGMQPFIDASVRAAAPGVFSAFGAAGGGGGGLQKAALDQSAIDAYAKLYQGERANQMTAAQALPGISQMPFDMQAKLASLAGGLPGQFSSYLGGSNTGGASGFANTYSGSSQTGSQTGTNKSTTTKPIYETPWWQTALGAGALAANFIPGIGPALSAGMSLGGGLLGGGRSAATGQSTAANNPYAQYAYNLGGR